MLIDTSDITTWIDRQIDSSHLLALGDEGGFARQHLVAQGTQRPPVHTLAIPAVRKKGWRT